MSLHIFYTNNYISCHLLCYGLDVDVGSCFLLSTAIGFSEPMQNDTRAFTVKEF